MILVFNQDGEARGLYSEQIDLRAIGALEMERASVIEFNADAQEWEVCTPTYAESGQLNENPGKILFSHESREECLRWERTYFENELDLATP